MLLFRWVDSYECYEDDAKVASSILGISLLRDKFGNTTMPMATFPIPALDVYLPRLIRAGKKVAIISMMHTIELVTPGENPK